MTPVALLAFCLAPVLLPAQSLTLEINTIPREAVAQRLNRLRTKDPERERELMAMFAEAGCTGNQLVEEPVHRKGPQNIICTLAGTTQTVLIVSAHVDHVYRGDGAVDDWSGASLLPSLYEALKSTPRKHTMQFIGFAEEELGLLGSGFHVAHMTREQRESISAVVNLECLGLSSTEVWVHVADKSLLSDLDRLSGAMHAPLAGVDIQKVGNDDTQPFRAKKIPTITIHSLTQATLPILHSNKDKLSAVDVDRLYESYRLIAEYLALIDQTRP